MNIAAMLRSIRQLTDVSTLLEHLGHQPLWEELAVDAVPARGLGVRSAVTVAHGGGFTWLALEAPDPRRAAHGVARRLAGRSGPSGVVVVSFTSRRIAFAVGFGAATALELSLDDPGAVALACVGRLHRGDGSALAYMVHAESTMQGESAGPEFFRRFRDTVDAAVNALPAHIPAADRHALALIQLTRVLLLYFIQSKGWLDGRADFLSSAVDRCLARGRRLQRDLLRPLFFGTLNRPRGERTAAAAALGRIPFLNGGLFEPHRLERHWRADLPTPFWRDAFDLLFERFHFTVSEGGGASTIAPDMLGRVFEGVMDPADRRETGTFYTPAALVTRVVDAALVAAVGAALSWSDAKAHERIAGGDHFALLALRRLTILDPAVGSGAFLLGALLRLEELRHVGCPEPVAPSSAVRRDILATNLFGVDRNAMAVRLAELRLWLAVVASEQDGPAIRVAPLPNLGCLIRQGDSLAAPAFGGGVPAGTARRIGELRRRTIAASGAAKQALSRELAASEVAAAKAALESAEHRATDRIADLLAATRAPNLFGDRPRLSAGDRRQLGRLRAARRATRAAHRRLADHGELPWFEYESHFADVFERGGFGLVVGNPPWVRAESLPAAVRERLAERYRWWRGSGAGFAHRPDLSVAFIERAHELVAPSGVLALLVPAKLVSAGYGAVARERLARTTCLHAVVDLTANPDAAFDATTYPLALIASKRSAPPDHMLRTGLEAGAAPSVRQDSLAAAPWILRAPDAAAVARRLGAAHPTFSDSFTAHLGVKTGADRVFLDPAGPIEPAMLRWALRGRDIKPFRASPVHRILWTHDEHGLALCALPRGALAHVRRHAATLRARSDASRIGGRLPYWALFRTAGALAEHRVVWADLARALTAAALGGPTAHLVPLNTCYVAVTRTGAEANCLAAWLNSTPIRTIVRLVASVASGGFARHGAATVGGLPLPHGATGDARLERLARIQADGGAPAAQAAEQVDAIVADHLGLDRCERDVLANAARADHRR